MLFFAFQANDNEINPYHFDLDQKIESGYTITVIKATKAWGFSIKSRSAVQRLNLVILLQYVLS